MHPLHLLSLQGDAPLPRQYGFPHLLALWGDSPVPPSLHSPSRPLFGTPSCSPWAGPVVDVAAAEARYIDQLVWEGRPLPAHEFSEDNSPRSSWWWPASIVSLHREASDEESYLKYKFRLQFPFRPMIHPGRANQSAEFLRQRRLLHGQLACSYAVFLLRTHLQEGITACGATRTAALAAATTRYMDTLLADNFLAAWLACPTIDVMRWGTANDPRDDPLPPPVVTSLPNASAWGGGGWGIGGGWGGGWGGRRPRRMPRPRGFRRIGVIFLPPRVLGRRHRRREAARRWLKNLERRWLYFSLHTL
ncbi:hypothetical protein C8F01DRAFT_1264414 [Mycena amicta]|nr:hypothetical protein C8F01DRAFT_1264414 [Mycena amicta]